MQKRPSSQVLGARLVLNGEHLLCEGVIVGRTQPASVPHKLHRLSQVPNQLARRYWRLVPRAVASLRAHHEATDWFDAKKGGTHAACR